MPMREPSETAQSDGARSRAAGIIWLGAGFALGIVIYLIGGGAAGLAAVCGAALAIVAALLVRSSPSREWALFALASSAVICGVAWAWMRSDRVHPHDLSRITTEMPQIMTLSGTARSDLEILPSAQGPLAVFGYRQPESWFRLSVTSRIDRAGNTVRASGEVLVRCAETLPPIRRGDQIEITGRLTPFQPAMNPGEFDRAQLARQIGQAGVLDVPERALVSIQPAGDVGPVHRIARWRDTLRRRASAWLLADLDESARPERRTLLAALILGDRGPDLHPLSDRFRRVGLAHLLAISGLHLGVLAGLVLLIFRVTGRPQRWHGVALIAIVLTYVFLIDVRMPVVRAAIMICIAAVGIAWGVRLRVGGLIAISAIALLIYEPAQILNAGFQLSYGVVFGLIYLTPRLRQLWFGPRDQLAESSRAMLLEVGKDLLCASVVAWAVASPIIAYHFGIVTPYAALAGVVALPIAALVLAFSFLKMLVAVILPSLATVVTPPLVFVVDLLLAAVNAIDHAPLSVLYVPHPSLWWTIGALVFVAALFVEQSRGLALRLTAAGVVIVLWLYWPVLPIHHRPALRIDMLAVGDGSCYIVRSGGSTVVYDAGSSGSLNAGQSIVLPALARLGVVEIDAVMITHANLDHYSAVLDLAERYDIPRVIVTPQFIEAVERDPLGPPAFLFDQLAAHRIPVELAVAGDMHEFGHAQWSWIHPDTDASFDRVNDESMVIAVDVAARRVLFTGDIQRNAIITLFARPEASLRADVLELPHHGSYNDAAEALVERADPAVILQSTGQRRYATDQWRDILDEAQTTRLITARDGMCTVTIDDDGTIETQTFVER